MDNRNTCRHRWLLAYSMHIKALLSISNLLLFGIYLVFPQDMASDSGIFVR